jgi:hypothetical protein
MAFSRQEDMMYPIEAEFFAEYPLYRKFGSVAIGRELLSSLPRLVASFQAECHQCGCERTFIFSSRMGGSGPGTPPPLASLLLDIQFSCAACKSVRRFFVKFAVDSLQKVGQDPPWSIEPTPAVRKAIGEHLDLYKKGLANESIGYGIGAYAYYRRITEEVIGSLLESVAELVPDSEREQYQNALDKARAERVADKKIRLVKDLLPVSLKIDGINPLDVLHSGLSEGLHARTDEECLELADAMRHALTHLLEEIQRAKERKGQFTDSMRKILAKNWGEQKANLAE